MHPRYLLGAFLFLPACGDDLHDPFPGLVRVSGASPYSASCGSPNKGFEVEPFVAVDPTDPLHLVGAWQQDRFADGAAAGAGGAVSWDGGATWTTSAPAFSVCAGGDYDRATDPWVAITADGTVYQIALAIDRPDVSAILVSRSPDGGESWGAPVTVHLDDDPDVFNDKEAMTADPTMPDRLYAVWDRLTGLTMPSEPIGTGPTMFARATDGVWEPARAIYDPGLDAQTIGNVIAVLPDGTLVDVFLRITASTSDDPVEELAAIRSTDQGDTWSAPVVIVRFQPIVVVDPATGDHVRSGAGLPSIAVDPTSGALHVAWDDGRFTSGQEVAIALSTSTDGGLTWSAPAQINHDPATSAFTPSLAVTAGGTLGVTYYAIDDVDPLTASHWLRTSTDGGATWTTEPLTEPFPMAPADLGSFYFLGDYQGLAASGETLIPFFAAAADPTDIFTRGRSD